VGGTAPADPLSAGRAAAELGRIQVLELAFGRYPQILPLNPALRADATCVRATLAIERPGTEPRALLSNLETRLLEVSPSLRRHQCRGPRQYHVFVHHAAPAGAPLEQVEAGLALAHLIEHVVIDAVAFLTGADSISGVTGALSGFGDRYDIYVECPEPIAALLAVLLALHWVQALASGQSLDGTGRPALQVARLLYQRRPSALDADHAAAALGAERGELEAALGWLQRQGIACPLPHTMKLSGMPDYRLCRLP
jgi:hypothetical protein